MKILATNLSIDSFFPKRVYFVGFDFEDYPKVSIREIQKALLPPKKSGREKAVDRKAHYKEPEYFQRCGHGEVAAMAPDGPQAVSLGKQVPAHVPRYGRDDLFAPMNEPVKPVTQRHRVDSHWGKSVWPGGGF